MKHVRIHLCRLALLFSVGLAGCGGGGSNVVAGPTPAAKGGTTAVTVRIDVPLTGPAASRRPAYVSPATQSLAIAVQTTGGQTMGTFSVNVTTASTACQTVTVSGVPTLTCTLSVPLTLPSSGTYMLATATYDQPQTQQCSPTGTPPCTGNVLSAALISATLQLNTANAVSIALGGLANGFTVTPVANGFVQGNVAGLLVWGPRAQSLVVQALDADGYTIVGNGAPTIALTTNSPAVQITAAAPGTFAIAATTSGVPAVVTPGTIALTLTATPVGSPALPFSQSVPLTIAHTALFVSNGATVAAYLDGNTAPSVSSLALTNAPRGVAVDANGTVYVGNHGSGTVTSCSAASTYATCSTPVSGLSFPEGVAIDASQNLWVAASGTNAVDEFLAGSFTLNQTLTTGLPTERGVSVDPSGNVWVADQSSAIDAFVPPSSTPIVQLTSGLNAPIGIADDAAGDLWVANSSGLAGEFAAPITGGSTLDAFPAQSDDTGVAVDATGTLWSANSSANSVVACPPPIFTATCTSFTVSGALWLAVYPSAVDP